MSIPARISAVTLACRGIGRMAAFYRQLSWPEAPRACPNMSSFVWGVALKYGARFDDRGGFIYP